MYAADVDVADAEDAGAGADFGNLFGGGLGLFDAAADDAGVGAEVDHGPGLGAADGARSAGDEEDPVGFGGGLLAVVVCLGQVRMDGVGVPKMPSAQTLLR